MQTHVNVSARVEQNRLETAKLLRKRLMHAHRKDQPVARKRIAIRQAIRTTRNVSLVLLAGSALVAAGVYLNLIPPLDIQFKGVGATTTRVAPVAPVAPVAAPAPVPPPPPPLQAAAMPDVPVQDAAPQLQLDFEMKPRVPNLPESASKPNLQ